MAYLKWMNKQSRLVKIIFCLPILDILWGIYRVVDTIVHFNLIRLVCAILWLVFGGFILWVLDLICIILTGHIFWFKG
ncbi:MAG: hypothetical protein Q4F15_02095 [Bacillota bacterium]|nr:hypothetical protein [Bacillota bacterium]